MMEEDSEEPISRSFNRVGASPISTKIAGPAAKRSTSRDSKSGNPAPPKRSAANPATKRSTASSANDRKSRKVLQQSDENSVSLAAADSVVGGLGMAKE